MNVHCADKDVHHIRSIHKEIFDPEMSSLTIAKTESLFNAESQIKSLILEIMKHQT